MEVIEKFQGKPLSANLPYKTQFLIPNEETGKEQKLICHLVSMRHDFARLLHLSNTCVMILSHSCLISCRRQGSLTKYRGHRQSRTCAQVRFASSQLTI